MDNRKRKVRSYSNTQNDETESKLRRSIRIQSCKMLNNRDLPLDIMLNIISRLPTKLLTRCKSLSKAFNHFISAPSFSHIYLTNRHNYLSAVIVDASKPDCFLSLAEIDVCKNHKISKAQIFNTDKLPGECSRKCRFFSFWACCNGLLCMLKLEFGLYNLFVINPLLGEFIQLPQPLVYPSHERVFFSYGLGYCRFTNRYKVLRIITYYLRPRNCKTNSEIFTIGCDNNWRCLSDVDVPYNIKWGHINPNPQWPMLPFRSALHWVVQPTMIQHNIEFEPSWGATICICAFDMTEENVTALPLPPQLVAARPFYGVLSVLLDKLCVLQKLIFQDVELWVMDEYGVQGSWTKHFVLNLSTLPRDVQGHTLKPLAVTPQGLIVLTNLHKIFSYDMKKKKCLRVIYQSKHGVYPFPFVPGFVSLRNLVQGPG